MTTYSAEYTVALFNKQWGHKGTWEEFVTGVQQGMYARKIRSRTSPRDTIDKFGMSVPSYYKWRKLALEYLEVTK